MQPNQRNRLLQCSAAVNLLCTNLELPFYLVLECGINFHLFQRTYQQKCLEVQVVKTKLFAKAYHRPGNLLPLLFHYRKPISLKNGTRTFHCIDLQRNFVLNSFKNTKASLAAVNHEIHGSCLLVFPHLVFLKLHNKLNA